MSINKLKVFNITYNEFLQNLKKCYIADKNIEVAKTVANQNIDKETLRLQEFLKCISGKESKITSKDNTIFDEPLVCFENIDISAVWMHSSVENREIIWKFIQTLALIAKTIRTKSNGIEDFCNKFSAENCGSESMLNMVKDLMGNLGSDSSDNDDDNIKDMFEGTKIGDLAKNIASTLDMSGLDDLVNLEGDDTNMKSPPDISEIMKQMTKDNGIQNIVKNVSDTLNTKMNDGSVNREELTDEVKSLMEKMKNNPKMKKMMNSKNMQNMMKTMMNNQGIDGDDSDDDFGNLEEIFKKQNPQAVAADIRGGGRRAAARKRLKKKIEAKRDSQVSHEN